MNLSKENYAYENSKIVFIPIIHQNDYKACEENFPQNFFMASKRLEIYDEEQGRELATEVGINTHPVINLTKKKSVDEILEIFWKLIADNKFIVCISNNIESSINLVSEQCKQFDQISILHLDSKARLKSIDEQNKNASLAREISDLNLDLVQVGLRSISKQEILLKQEKRIKQFLASEIKLGMYGPDWQEIVTKNLQKNVFLLLDISVFDPSIMEVENPEPDGLLWDEVMYLLKILGQEKNVVGVAVSGIPECLDGKRNTYYYTAKLVYKILNYVL